MATSRPADGSGPPGAPMPHILREYSFIADGERGALIGPKGEIVWMCAPAWHSDAVFSALIGGGGSYVVCPADPWFVWGGYYEEASLIWHSRFTTSDGVVECREALAFPGEPDRAVVLRRVSAVVGAAKVGIRFDPRAGFGRHGLTEVRRSTQVRPRDGTAVEVLEGRSGPLRLRWSGAGDVRRLRSAGGAFAAELGLKPGAQHDLVLEISDRALPDELPDPDLAWAMTEDAWSKVAPQCSTAVARRDARHAYAVLRGLTSASGGMVAAATMSLPERAETGRELRLPLRLGAGSVLRRPRRRRGGAARPGRGRSGLRHRAAPRRRAAVEAGLPGRRGGGAGRAPAERPQRVPRRIGQGRQLGERPVPAGHPGGDSRAPGGGRSLRPADRGRQARHRRRCSGHRGALAGARCRHLGARAGLVGPFPARMRGRLADHRRLGPGGRRRRRPGRTMGFVGRRHPRRDRQALHPPERPLAAVADRRASRRGIVADPRCAAPFRGATPGPSPLSRR